MARSCGKETFDVGLLRLTTMASPSHDARGLRAEDELMGKETFGSVEDKEAAASRIRTPTAFILHSGRGSSFQYLQFGEGMEERLTAV